LGSSIVPNQEGIQILELSCLFGHVESGAMARMFGACFLVAVRIASGMELTSDNWDASVEGKSVFIKFLAPW